MSFSKNILLVEDDYLDIMNVERVLDKINFRHKLLKAKNGFEALDILNQLKNDPAQELPSIVILDINMPRMNGFEFLEKIRADRNYEGLSVFITTTSDEEGDKLMSKNLGISGYIVKPLSFDKFQDGRSSLDSFGLMLDLLKI